MQGVWHSTLDNTERALPVHKVPALLIHPATTDALLALVEMVEAQQQYCAGAEQEQNSPLFPPESTATW